MQNVIPPSSPTERDTVQPQAYFVTISDEDAGQRIDNYLLRVCKGVPKSHIYRILRSGEVRVNKGRIDQLYRLEAGDIVRIPPVRVAEKSSATVPGAEFTILHEDSHILVIDKPCGVAVQVQVRQAAGAWVGEDQFAQRAPAVTVYVREVLQRDRDDAPLRFAGAAAIEDAGFAFVRHQALQDQPRALRKGVQISR